MEFDGHGVLLCGDSGAGKVYSFLRLRTKWLEVSLHDCSRLVQKRTGRIVTGNAYQMRFRESAIQLFPELIDERVNPRAAGELAIELPTAAHQQIAIISECHVDYIVFLNRVDPTPEGLFPFSKSIAFQWFQQVVCYGEKRVRDAHYASLRNLLSVTYLRCATRRWIQRFVS